MLKPCTFNIPCKDVKIDYPQPPPEKRESMCPEGPQGPQKLSCLPAEKKEEINPLEQNYEEIRSPEWKPLPLKEEKKASPVICPCMLPLPEYLPPDEIIPIRHEIGSVDPEDPLLCPSFYKHPCPAAISTGVCPAHITPHVGDICPSSKLDILKDGKISSKDVLPKDHSPGRFISCDEDKIEIIRPSKEKEEIKQKDPFEKVPEELKTRYREHYRICNLPARPDHPGWFPGYRCEWPSSQLLGYRTTQMDYGWYPPNIYTISHIHKPKLNEFTRLYGRFGCIFNQSLNL